MPDQVHEGENPSPTESSDERPSDEATAERDQRAAAKEQSRQQSRSISAKEAARTVGTGKKGAAKGRPASPQKASPTTRSANGAETSRKAPASTKAAGTSSAAGAKRQKPPTAKAGTKGGPNKAGQGKGSASATRPKGPGGPSRNGRQAARRGGPGGRSTTTLLTWGTAALVLVIVVVLVLVKILGGGSSAAVDTPLPASIYNDITTVPASTFNTVGVNSSATTVTAPFVIKNQAPLTYTVDGKKLPGMLYVGAEYCPYCAAERWSMAVALSRFGKFHNLQQTSSSTTDAYPGTPTLSFYKSSYASSYLAFKSVEMYSNQPASSGQGYQPLQKLTKQDGALAQKYESTKYAGQLGSTSGGITFPFVDIGNHVIVIGAGYSPAILSGLSHAQIASDLHDPSNPVTQAIIANANYLTAGICSVTGSQPTSVCTSKGVTAAAKAMHLKL